MTSLRSFSITLLLALAAPAVATPCGDWSRAAREDFTNRALPNFGCADANNLAAQLADPIDLVRGRGTGRQSGEAAARAVERWRSDTVTPFTGSEAAATPPTAPK